VLTIFGMGGVAGMALGSGVIGPVALHWGWRAGFFVLGIPGALLALLAWLTVREPVRGAFDGTDPAAHSHGTRDVLAYLLGQRSLALMIAAAALHAIASMGAGMFYVAYLMRVHGMNVGQAGFAYMWVGPLAGAVGGLLGGILTDRLGQRDIRWYMWVPAASALFALPFSTAFVLWPAGQTFEFAGQVLPVALGVILPASLVGAMWNGPTLAMVQTLARPHMRALASALTTGSYNLIGMGLGPVIVGLVSDHFKASMGEESIRYGLLVVVLSHLGGAALNLLAARHLRADHARVRA
jgi:predicted MFS family arabinose efflux permease